MFEDEMKLALQTTQREDFDRLVEHLNIGVRINLAKNNNCPSDILDILLDDVSVNVIKTAIDNRNCRKYNLPTIRQEDLDNSCIKCTTMGATFERCRSCNSKR